ncbi:rhodanese-like domain-containing protein [Daejeonella sp.]|uniref:rhodanese-like domain-containing protein n=1 Tax=Daejeonella sp. TaxID=2805397 RepID=UPI00398372A8
MNISAADFNSSYKENNSLTIIDVREKLEFDTFNLGGTNIPLGTLISEIEDLEYSKDEEIIVICQHGLRSETARQILSQKGYINVRNLNGGLLAMQKLKSQTSLR